MRNVFLMTILFTLIAIPESIIGAAQNQLDKAADLQAPAAFKTAEGELTKVDSVKLMFWIKAADGKEMAFNYTSQTQVTGGDNTTQGLSKLGGSHLRIHYEIVAGSNQAVKIEIQAPKT